MTAPWLGPGGGSRPKGADYDARFEARARAGHDVHGEAAFVETLRPGSVLDAGCGTGRVAIELARCGITVTGVDSDAAMIDRAREKAPELTWILADLTSATVPESDGGTGPRRFDVAVMAGNVLLFTTPGTEAAVVANLARHLAPGGFLVAGFQLLPGRLDLVTYDADCAAAGLALAERWATWDRKPWTAGGDYAVSVHAAPSAGRGARDAGGGS